jgi:hypothetical protein
VSAASRSKVVMCVFEWDIRDMDDEEFSVLWGCLGKIARRRSLAAAQTLGDARRVAELHRANREEAPS